MTQPNNTSGDSSSSTPSENRTRVRPGQLVLARIEDYLTKIEKDAHAVVLKVLGDVAHLAILGGGGHAAVSVDKLSPAKPEDVHNPLPAPEPDAEGSTGS